MQAGYGRTAVLHGVSLTVNSGEIVRFEGNVRMSLMMDQPEAEPAEPPKTRSLGGSARPAGTK